MQIKDIKAAQLRALYSYLEVHSSAYDLVTTNSSASYLVDGTTLVRER
jgi:hypothetical protein